MSSVYNLNQNEPELYRLVYKEFGKTREELEEYIEMIYKWAETQHHFPEKPAYHSVRFSIIANKCSIEKTKEKIDMYYTIRSLMPEIYGRHPLSPEMIKHNQVVIYVPLPKFAANQTRVSVAQIVPEHEPDEFSHELFLVSMTHLIEVCLNEDTCFNFSLILDFKGAKVGHIAKFSPMLVKKTSVCLEKVYSNRVATIYIINFHSFLEPLFNAVIMPFLSKKLREKIKILNSPEKLLEVYDKEILPKDLGGEEKPLAELRDLWMKKYEEYKWRFDKRQEMLTDESKRPTKLVNDDILGYYGSFMKINVD